ncbi:hypothetical protein [Anaerosinus massiliensis]|uniref:hypothetical protein n=1 Tax=Massilibacillus massiliensis TaxID=1806837 RepID=UPI0018FEB997|nr:hypothetical protein [Massilibacillus massiliensis]
MVGKSRREETLLGLKKYKENPSKFILEQAMFNLVCSSEGSMERIEAVKFLNEIE